MKRSITERPGRKQQTLQQFNTRRKRSRGGRGEKGGQEVQVKGRCNDERENNEHFSQPWYSNLRLSDHKLNPVTTEPQAEMRSK